jgi:hypothetical protein
MSSSTATLTSPQGTQARPGRVDAVAVLDLVHLQLGDLQAGPTLRIYTPSGA